MTDDIKKKAEEWADIIIKPYTYKGHVEDNFKFSIDSCLKGVVVESYLAGAKERDKWWAERWIAYIDSIRPNITQSFDVIQSMVDELNQASKEALEES